eukprot:Gb_29766 [translate_table: standard]
MALRRALLQILNQYKHGGDGTTHRPGNLLNVLAYKSAFSAGDKLAVQAKSVFEARGMQTKIGGSCEDRSEENETTTRNIAEANVHNAPCSIDSESKSELEVGVSEPNVKNKSVQFSPVPDLKISKRHDLAMVYTCKVCETRSVKTMRRESYEKGIVIVRCGGCNNLHLIADRLGWFGEPSSVEDFLRANGEEVRKGLQGGFDLTLEDLAGRRPK